MSRFTVGQNVRLTKLRDADNITGHNRQPVGKVVEGKLLNLPRVGESLVIRRPDNTGYRTSTTQQIVDVNEFQFTTHNSVYKLEAL